MAKAEDGLYNRWKAEHNMTTSKGVKGKYEKMMDVRDSYVASRNYLQTKCPWNESMSGDSGDDSGSYFNLREQQLKAWGQWYKPFPEDEFKSNVKSPMTSGRVEAAMHKIKQMNVKFVCKPTEDADRGKAKIVNEVLNFLFDKGRFKYELATWFKDGLIHGNGIARVYYMKKQRSVKLAVTDPKEMTKEQKKELKENEGKKAVYGETEKKLEYDDITIEPVPLVEFFPDPNARCIHGNAFTASWVIRRRMVSFEQFLAEYESDPDCVDVDKVKSTGYYKDETLVEEFEFPHDDTDGEFVEILEKEDVISDQLTVVANDIVIKDTPLPYNHKQITYIKIGCIEHPHQFWWLGLADRVLAFQAEEEILKNLNYDAMHERLKDKYIVNKGDYNKFLEAYKETGGRFMPADSRGRPLNQVVEFIPQNPIDPTVFNILEGIQRDATTATQFDPSQLSAIRKDLTATQSMMNQQIADSFIQATMESFGEGLIIAAQQIVALMQQYYTVPRVKKIMGEDDKVELKEELRKIRLEGKRIEIEGEEINVEESEEEYEFFDVEGEYLNLQGDLDIQLSSESMRVENQALDAQMSQQALAQVMPFAIDPGNPKTAEAVPVPLFNAVKIARWYVESNGLPEDVLLHPEEKPEADMQRAIIQNAELNKGKSVTPVPGESEEHQDVHQQQLAILETEADNLMKEMGELPLGAPPKEFENRQKAVDELNKVIQAYAAHLDGDSVPMLQENDYLLSKAQPPMPQGGGMMPPEMGGQSGGMPAEAPTGAGPISGAPMPPGMAQPPGMGGY